MSPEKAEFGSTFLPGNPAESTKPQKKQRAEIAPYTVVRRPRDHSDIEIDENGNFHIFWGSGEKKVHHGGSTGFTDLEKAIHQHQRVILKYLGFEISLTRKEAIKLALPDLDFNLVKFAASLKQNPIVIAGESQEVTDIAEKLLRTIAYLPGLKTRAERDLFSTDLLKIKRRIGAVRDLAKQRAAVKIAAAASSTKPGEVMDLTTKASLDLFERAANAIGIVRGSLNRLEILFEAREEYERIIRIVFYWLNDYLRQTGADGSLREIIKKQMIENFDPDFQPGLLAMLKRVDGQPYKARVDSREVRRLARIPQYLEEGRNESVAKALKGAIEKFWRVVEQANVRGKERFSQVKLPPSFPS